jgi:hypothetical protein
MTPVLKEDYQPVVQEQLKQAFLILAQIEKNTRDFEGLRALHAIHVGRNSGVGARGSGAVLPTAGNQSYAQVKIPTRRMYGAGKIDRALMNAMKSNRGSFFRGLAKEMDGLVNDVKRDVNRQIWGTSDGIIAATTTTSNSTTVNLASTATETQVLQIYADGGGLIDIGTAGDPDAVATARLVTGYSIATPGSYTITISGAAVTTTGSHRIYRSGAGGASDNTGVVDDGQYELTGIQEIVDDSGILHTVDPSTYSVWAATVDSNSGTNRAWSESTLVKLIQNIERKSGRNVDLLASGPGVWRSIMAFYAGQRRQLDKVELKGGFGGLRFSAAGEMMTPGSKDKALVFEFDCPENRQYALSTEALILHELSDFEFVDDDGDVLSRSTDGTDSFDFYLAGYKELGCVQRNAHGVIEDLNQS